jgi:gamma-glutamyltranspeptidase/glutathione hydrolase
MVASSQPLAAEAGLEILKRGGNAIDAAVAAAAVLNVVEPGSAGIGGDMFTIVWSAKDKQLLALNGSGRAPAGATLEHLRSVSKDGRMPQHGIDSVTVPGAVDGWDMLLKRLGSMGFRELLAPAARIAEEGFGVSERIRNDWIYGAKILAQDRDSVRTYLVNGHLPDNYALFRNPDLAHALHVLQEQGRDAFYTGKSRRPSSPNRRL